MQQITRPDDGYPMAHCCANLLYSGRILPAVNVFARYVELFDNEVLDTLWGLLRLLAGRVESTAVVDMLTSEWE